MLNLPPHSKLLYHFDTSFGGIVKKSAVFDLAILGLLQESPLHGYELRKRLSALMGAFRAISYGSLYPALRSLAEAGYISETGDKTAPGPALSSKRARITYSLTKQGVSYLKELLQDSGPDAWEDEGFGVRFAFFAHTEEVVRQRILEGRRTRLAERSSQLKKSLANARDRIDQYTLELHRHGLEGVENELRWIEGLIAAENKTQRTGS
ncbi:MAG: PadR family transcriptional regulator [Candidatus Nanopelagicales bacterium]